MKVMLDTHAFLWFVLDDPQLSATARGLIEEPANDVFVSPASYWEIAIKIRLGKLDLRTSYNVLWSKESSVTTSPFCRSNPSIRAC